MSDRETTNCRQQSQRHAGYFSRVRRTVAHRQAGHYHVGVSYRLHLSSALQAARTHKNLLVAKSEAERPSSHRQRISVGLRQNGVYKQGCGLGAEPRNMVLISLVTHKADSCWRAERLSASQEGFLLVSWVSSLLMYSYGKQHSLVQNISLRYFCFLGLRAELGTHTRFCKCQYTHALYMNKEKIRIPVFVISCVARDLE